MKHDFTGRQRFPIYVTAVVNLRFTFPYRGALGSKYIACMKGEWAGKLMQASDDSWFLYSYFTEN